MNWISLCISSKAITIVSSNKVLYSVLYFMSIFSLFLFSLLIPFSVTCSLVIYSVSFTRIVLCVVIFTLVSQSQIPYQTFFLASNLFHCLKMIRLR